jgi:hypothetical protein
VPSPLRYWYDIDEIQGCVFILRTGEYSHKKWMPIIDLINTDARLKPGMNRIHAYGPDSTTPTTAQTHQLAEKFQRIDSELGTRKVAFIATESHRFGMLRMYENLRNQEHSSYLVCRTFDEAKKWVGLPSDYQDPFPPFDQMKET